MTPLHFGVVLPSYGPQAERLALVDTAQVAEDLGFDAVWLTDHVALPKEDAERFGRIFEAITTLAYLAGVTRKIGLGISALVLPQRNPVIVAKQMATADRLSGGRTRLAVGIGWSEGEYRNLGQSFRDRAKRMDEAIQVLRTMWRGPKVVSYEGTYYTIRRAVMDPGPLQPGGPPLWVAGNSPASLRRAALLADGWHPNARGPETLRSMLSAAKPLLGTRPFDVVLRIRLAWDQAEPPYPGALHGSTEQVVQQMARYLAAGATGFVITFEAASQRQRERAMQRFMDEARPALDDLLRTQGAGLGPLGFQV
ncbi:MAG: TIGR03619 family F420-dependent LLM class oxidoreductase [Chloroflexi bacterium]|nr:TIGR03619 family F420-dependent LLM class oxidoreductase [Chloroflexota bacterium]